MQETYARWYALSRQQQDAIASPGAWLPKVAGDRITRTWAVRNPDKLRAWTVEPPRHDAQLKPLPVKAGKI